jgi:4-alpha-glucanotransferase
VSGARVREALRALGIERLALGVHDANFPGDADEDIGRGTPNGNGADDFFRFAAELGFDTIQLGPQGETSEIDPSPYDGSVFVRNSLSIALTPLVERGWLSEETRRRVVLPPTDRCDHRRACRNMRVVLDEVLHHHPHDGHDRWGLFDAMTEANGNRDFTEWDTKIKAPPRVMHRTHLAQTILAEQHAAMRARAHALGLSLYADLQVGWSRRELWAFSQCFMPHHRMGAPPSRTNPEGQPWGYPVLDPARPNDVASLLDTRFRRIAEEYDGVRVDHPHGLVCPWVYRDDVQRGGRLHETHDDPELLRFAIARPEQIDRTRVPWDEHWVRSLDDAQVDRYAVHIDRLIHHVGRDRVLCEVLSTMPYPLGRVLEKYGLGRFRVTQKAGLDDPRDVYRSENAEARDWIMVGNHDTAPIWLVTRSWDHEKHARYLEERLKQPVGRDPAALARAKLAELFASPAKHVYVWWGDLMGETEWYNRPGTVSDDNWSKRIPPDFRRVYAERCAAGVAFDLRVAVQTALRARGLRV